jgi:hypothetical protein
MLNDEIRKRNQNELENKIKIKSFHIFFFKKKPRILFRIIFFSVMHVKIIFSIKKTFYYFYLKLK